VLALAGCGGGSAERPRPTTPSTTTAATPSASPAELARRRRAQAPHVAAGAPGETRAALIRRLRRSILRDARARVKRHALEGPILDVSCELATDDRPYAAEHPDAPILRYRCLAVTFRARTSPPTELGTPFVARVDFARSRYAWCLFVPVGGEGTHTASTFSVPPSPACAAPPQ
jgi:hypothetical protein